MNQDSESKELIALDIETDGLIENGIYPGIICVSYCDNNGSGVTTNLEEVKELIKGKRVIFHNSSFDVPILKVHGIEITDIEDTMLMSYCWDTTGKHSLDEWGKRLGYKKLKYDFKVEGFEVNDKLLEYAKRDAEVTWKLYKYLFSRMDDNTTTIYKEVELPYSFIIREMEDTGMYFNPEKTYSFYQEISETIKQAKEEISQRIGLVPDKLPKKYKKEHPDKAEFFIGKDEENNYLYKTYSPFNIASGYHKAYALMELEGWEPTEFTKTDIPITDSETLAELPYELAKKFVDIGKLMKIESSFLKPILEKQDEQGFVYANFNQTVTVTGRLSSSSPNLQNLPSKGELGDRMRALVSDDFHPDITIVGGDLSNIEARVLAFYLLIVEKDRSMADAFINNMDLHQVNADNWGLERSVAKMVLYLTLYGGGAKNLAGRLSVPEKEAEDIINQVYTKLPALQRLKDKVFNSCKKNGYITTIGKRNIHYPDINSRNKWKRYRAERQCFNALLQGSAADILKILSIRSIPLARKYDARFVAAVHDESLFYCSTEMANQFATEISELWKSSGLLREIPTLAEFKVGKNWSEIH